MVLVGTCGSTNSGTSASPYYPVFSFPINVCE